MLTRTSFDQRFARRALFGMVHLGPLPGAPLFGGAPAASAVVGGGPAEAAGAPRGIAGVLEAALADARAIAEGGCDGLVIENFGDRPFARGRVEAETVAAMTRIVSEIAREVRLPIGINVLRNDALSALAIAAATGAAFIRVNVHTGAMVTDQGIIEGDAYTTLRKRAALAPDVLIFADYLVKHATPLGEQSPKDLRLRGLADALIVSGSETGSAADPARFAALREAVPDAPLLVGSGLSAANAAQFDADGAIVGTSIQVDGRVDAALVRQLALAFKR